MFNSTPLFQNSRNWILFISLHLLFISCKYDHLSSIPDLIVNDTETVNASVHGIVVNENNIPVPGAQVKCGIATTTTDIYGMFTFKGITISKNNGYVKVSKTGYFNGNRTFITTAGRTHNVRIKLIPKTNTGTFSAAAGGSVSLASGGKVIFTSNSITDAAGTAYTGTVNVAMAWINPTAADLGSILQGDLRGITAAGYERALETYGMLGVELTGATGQELKIATGKNAELSIPIPAALQSTAPASIPLWHFDETKGRWIEEGNATKIGNNYVGTVTHFSFWNCDIGANSITLCVNVVNSNNQPLNNATVRIRRANFPASMGYGQTDSLGTVCGLVFQNEPLVLEVLSPCGLLVYSQNIGPYSANASVNIVANIPAVNSLIISGTLVNCSNTAVANGYVFIYLSTGGYVYAPVVNGTYAATLLNCSGNTISFSVTGVDNANQQQGGSVSASGTSGTVTVPTVTACGTNVAQFINLLIDGTPFNWTAPIDSFGSFTNTSLPPGWSNGSSIFSYSFIDPALNKICNFAFGHNATPGPGFMVSGSIQIPGFGSTQQLINNTATTTFTELGQPFTFNGFIAGNFTGAVFDFNGTNRTVNGSFRVRRY